MPDAPVPALPAPDSTGRRALLAGIGGIAAGSLLLSSRAQAGPLTPPPGAPSPTAKPLGEIEPRVAVTPENLPGDASGLHVITQPGSYYLVGNITGETGKHGIVISSNHVTLDLGGFRLAGLSGALNGIHVTGFRLGVVIRNGIVTGWPRAGVSASIDSGAVENIHVVDNGEWGITHGGGWSARITGCSAYNNGASGVDFGGIRGGEGAYIEACQARNNLGIGIWGFQSCIITNCVAVGNTGSGIDVQRECTVAANTASGNGANGIRAVAGSNQVERNLCVSNTTGIGLRVDAAGNTVSGNTVRGNATNYQFAAGNQLELLISQIPQVLSWPCSAKLQGTLTGVAGQSGITIASDDVTLDLGDHALRGVPTSLDGIVVTGSRSRIKLRAGAVSDWGVDGVDLANATDAVVEDVVVASCGQYGIIAGNAGVVRRCKVRSCSYGIRGVSGGHVADCAVTACSTEAIQFVSGGTIENNDVRSNTGLGIRVFGPGCLVRGNTVIDNGGNGLQAAGAGNTFSGNTVRGNGTNYVFVAGNQLELLVSQIPQTLSWPCMATLQGTLTGVVNQHGITVASNDVAIDLAGHALVGGGGTEFRSGIIVESGDTRKNIMVRNGTLSGWRSAGLYAPNAASLMVEDVVAVGNFVTGFDLGQSYVTMTRCAAHGPSSVGISGAAGGGTFVQCSANQCGTGFSLSGDCTVQDCKATANSGVGIGLFDSGTVTNSTASYNGDSGFRGTNAVFTACISRNNQTGFQLIGGSVSGCYAFANTRRGVSASGALVVGNTVSANGVSSEEIFSGGIIASSGCRIEGNDCRGNRRGIKADFPPVADCIIIRNTCRDNTLNWEIGFGNAVAPIVQATTNPAFISGDTYAGNLGSTDPNANFTY